MTSAAYIVEKIDPYAVRPDLTDETRECATAVALADTWEDLTDRDRATVDREAMAFVNGEVDALAYTDPETGVEVTARAA